MVIPLDEECFWCIVPYEGHVEILRQNETMAIEFGNFDKMSITEKELICNKLVQAAMEKCSDVPDVSKRPICFEV